MDKVIVERPRYGSRLPSRKKGYRKYIQSIPIEDLPRNEPMLGRWKGREKWLNEHLGPMKRFLRSNVGRPWNHIYRDLCEHVSFANAVQSHVLDHIFDFVHQHVEVKDRFTVHSHRWYGWTRLRPDEMYICQSSGILKVVRRKSQCGQLPDQYRVNELTRMIRRDANWWEVRLVKFEDDSMPSDFWDAWLEKEAGSIPKHLLHEAYGGKYLAVSKRMLPPGETRRLYREIRAQKKRKKTSKRRRRK